MTGNAPDTGILPNAYRCANCSFVSASAERMSEHLTQRGHAHESAAAPAPAALTVYVVEYGNYDPPEIESLWATQELADRRVAELKDGPAPWHPWPWRAHGWEVGTE